MKLKTLLATCLTSGALAVTSAYADHNSVWGEGWANMPNDIHNTRIETLDVEDGNEIFTEFVRGGDAADSDNEAELGDDVGPPREESNANLSASGTMNRGLSGASNRYSGGAMNRGSRR